MQSIEMESSETSNEDLRSVGLPQSPTPCVPMHPDFTFMTGQPRQQELTYLWTIHDIKAHMKNFRVGEKIETSTFTINDSKWHFELYPQNHANYSTSHIVIFLVSENDETFIVDFEVSVGKLNLGHGVGWAYSHTWENNRIGENGLVGASNFLPHSKVYEEEELFIQDHKMDFFMKVYIRNYNSTSTDVIFNGITQEKQQEKMLEKLSQDTEKFLTDSTFSDFSIICSDRKFLCHKMILASRSSYFQALFTGDWREKTDDQMEVSDTSPEIFQDILKYIYSGKVIDLERKAKQLIKPADMYDLKLLKEACEVCMVNTVTAENAIEFLILADLHRANNLKASAMRIILDNKSTIVNQSNWKDTFCSNPGLLCEIFEALALQSS